MQYFIQKKAESASHKDKHKTKNKTYDYVKNGVFIFSF